MEYAKHFHTYTGFCGLHDMGSGAEGGKEGNLLVPHVTPQPGFTVSYSWNPCVSYCAVSKVGLWHSYRISTFPLSYETPHFGTQKFL